MGDNGRFYLKLVKATLITIVMLGHHGWGTMGMFWGTMPIIGIDVHGAPSKWKIYIFKDHYPQNILHFTIKNVLIDTGSPSDMPVDMFIVLHPHVHGAPSLGHHGHFLDFF